MDVKKLNERAVQAAERGNHDYAIELYQQLLTIKPDDVGSRRELRAVERRKFQEAGGISVSVKLLALIRGLVPLLQVGITTITKSHERRMIVSENFLKHNPECASILGTLAVSAEAADYTNTAVFVYEDIKRLFPKQLSSLRRLARLYQKLGEINGASECFKCILNSKPNDEEALQAIKDLAALKTMQQGKWNEAGEEGGYKKMLRDKEQTDELIQKTNVDRNREDVDHRLQRVKADLEKDPKNIKILFQILNLYVKSNSFVEAKSICQQIKEIDSKNSLVDRKLAELEVAEKKAQLEIIRKKLEESPNDSSLKQELASKTKEFASFEVEQLKLQVAVAPTDLSLKLKLGMALFNGGNIDDAIQQFQQASRDPKNRRVSSRMIGDCFIKKKMFDMAIEQYNGALKDISGMNNEGKEINYRLGICYEALKQLDKAEEIYKSIYQEDINFRDVAKKIEHLYKKRDDTN